MPGFFYASDCYMDVTDRYPKVYLYRRIVQAKLFIDVHYAEPIDLGNIADQASFSKFHFIRQFKKIYGKTPHQYLKAVRIERAMKLLRDNIPVLDTCMLVGFESPTSFSGTFKQIVGVSPSVYLQQQHERKTSIAQAPLDYIPGCFAASNGWIKEEQL